MFSKRVSHISLHFRSFSDLIVLFPLASACPGAGGQIGFKVEGFVSIARIR